MIHVLEDEQVFHLQTKNSSFILQVLPTKHMVMSYWGNRVEGEAFSFIIEDIKRASYLADTDGIKDFKLEQMPQLYPTFGNPDLRTPAITLLQQDGSRIVDFRYQCFSIYKRKKKILGLPSLRDKDTETLEITLFDSVIDVTLTLTFSVYEDKDVISQSVSLTNNENKEIMINKIMSSCLSFLNMDFKVATLTGAWGRENHLHLDTLSNGHKIIDSKRGASGHGQNPFIALLDTNATEDFGNVYGMQLLYSGSFIIDVEVDMHQNTRCMLGINPFDFSWHLGPGETFYTPEAVLTFSNQGLGGMTKNLHTIYQEVLLPPQWKTKIRPILVNNWEATYYHFNASILENIIKEASTMGIELFVLDDGWFGHRNSVQESLGDWIVNEEKIGGSLTQLSAMVKDAGMQFGLWFEPEMVSPNSELYRKHPDWIIQVSNRIPQLSRYQYVLDISNPAVQEYIIDALSRILDTNAISYVKWDMNRNITDSGSRYLEIEAQQELGHRYILGLYYILETLTKKYPDILFEGCAGGGGRYDLGMLYYMPQIWASDTTDAIERLEIQYGTLLIYPAITMGAHVSAVPNHQVGRNVPLKTRGIVAMQGNLGYELDFTKISKKEKIQIQKQILLYKEIRETVQLGTYYSLDKKDNSIAWMYISKDTKQVVVSYVQILAHANTVPKRLRLKGLPSNASYQVKGENIVLESSAYEQIGLALPQVKEDYYAKMWILQRVDT